jgi:DnaJ-class molecular chaperone
VSDNPYEILGVRSDSSADEIRKAYRRLAKKCHPDLNHLNPGNSDAENEFKRISAAYDVLSDPEKRKQFDRGDIDASGAERPRQRFYRDYAEAAEHPYTSYAGFDDFMTGDDVLSEVFRRRTRARGGMPSHDTYYRLPLEFLEAINGTTKQVRLINGDLVELKIPVGTHNGQVLRLRGYGDQGRGDAPTDDALFTVEVLPHRIFRRDGDDIRIELPISLREAVVGDRIEVPTPTGAVLMTIPKGSNTGRILRLRGKGVQRPDGSRGDLYVTLWVMFPQNDSRLEDFVESWNAGKAHNPREGWSS